MQQTWQEIHLHGFNWFPAFTDIDFFFYYSPNRTENRFVHFNFWTVSYSARKITLCNLLIKAPNVLLVQRFIYETTNTEIGLMNITYYIGLPFGRAPMAFNQYSLQVDPYIIGPYVAIKTKRGPPWSWSYGSLIYNYLCNQCISPLTLWVRTPFIARCTRYTIMW